MIEPQGRCQMCSSSQPNIMNAQCDLLIPNLKNPETIALVKENIEHTSGGTSPHHGNVLKLGFKKAFERKKWERDALLRCSNIKCDWCWESVPYSSVGSGVYCPRCSYDPPGGGTDNGDSGISRRYYMHCANCGRSLISHSASCAWDR